LRLSDNQAETSRRPRFCNLPKVTGRCRASIDQYYFVPSIGDCVFFVYGGCEGNENRFDSLEECRQKCRADVQSHPTESLSLDRPAEELDGMDNEIGDEEYKETNEISRDFDYELTATLNIGRIVAVCLQFPVLF
uniref:BPTI/Kunitz inhibitor domain-containing protein n=1 Tax=Anisakis simplex TaxID=6269 RepID=A0A0M3JAB8_ANISI